MTSWLMMQQSHCSHVNCSVWSEAFHSRIPEAVKVTVPSGRVVLPELRPGLAIAHAACLIGPEGHQRHHQTQEEQHLQLGIKGPDQHGGQHRQHRKGDALEQQAAAGLREGLDLDGPAPLQDAAAARQPLSHVKQPCRILRQVIVQLKKLGHGA